MTTPSRSTVTATIEFDSALGPLARVTLPNHRSGYVHYSTLITRMRAALSTLEQSNQAASNGSLLSGPSVDMLWVPGVGSLVWPESKVVVIAYHDPVRRIRLTNNALSDPIQLPTVLWVMKFKRRHPFTLQTSKLFLCEKGPLTVNEAVMSAPWPFGNVHADGLCCWGHISTENLIFAHPDRVDAAWWNAKPNTDLLRDFRQTAPYHVVSTSAQLAQHITIDGLAAHTPVNEHGIRVVPFSLMRSLYRANSDLCSRTITQIASRLSGD